MTRKTITFDSFIRGGIGVVVILGLLMLLQRLSGVLLPFFIAWLIAYLVYPLVTFIQYRLKFKNRMASIVAAFTVLLAIGVGAFYLVVPPFVAECSRVSQLITEYFAGRAAHSNIPQVVSEFLREHVDFHSLRQVLEGGDLVGAIKQAVPQLWSIIAESFNFLFSIFTFFIILLYVVFILLDYESISEGWIRLVPVKYRVWVTTIRNDVVDGMNRYFRGQTFVAFCVGVLFSIGFLIIDFPLAIGLGMFIGLLNLVPYLQVIGLLPTILLAILKAADTGSNFWIVLASAMIVFIVVQAIQDGFIVPKVMGHITGLNPAVILLSLSIWGSLLGMLGMIIALPLTTLMLAYYRRFIINQEKLPDATPDGQPLSEPVERTSESVSNSEEMQK